MQADLPAQFPNEIRSSADDLFNIVEFSDHGESKTRIISWGIGYGVSEVWDQFIDSFIKGNEW